MLLLGVTLGVMAAGDRFAIASVGMGTMAIFATHMTPLYGTYRAGGHPSWEPIRESPPQGPSQCAAPVEEPAGTMTIRVAWITFAICSLAILVAGWLVMHTAEALTQQTGLGASFVGATLVAIATSLPEISTTTAAVRRGNYEMAVSNIFGSTLARSRGDQHIVFVVASLSFQSRLQRIAFAVEMHVHVDQARQHKLVA